MGIGMVLGGAAEGMQAQEKLNIAQQAEERAAKVQQTADADKQITATMTHIGEIMKAAAESGHDPKTLVQNGAIQSLLQSAQGLAARVGRDPNQLSQLVQAMALRPPLEDAEKTPKLHKFSGGGIEPDRALMQQGDKFVPIDPKTGQPIQDATTPQPVLAPSEIITPPQAQRANPPGVVPPVAPVAPVAPGQPDTPVSPVAMRFPSPDQGAVPAVPAPVGPTLPQGMKPGIEAVDYAIKNNVTGPAFLEALPPIDRNTVKDVADYKRDPASVSKRGDKQSTVQSWAHQYTNGEYDPKWYKPMQAALKEFTSGGSTSPASKIEIGNTAIAHGGQVADAIDKLKAVPGLLQKMEQSNTPFVSYAAAALKNQSMRGTSAGAALQAFLTASHHFVDETTKFYAGGQPAEAGRERGLENFNAAKSETELYQALNSESELLSGKVGALQDRWKTAMAGPKGLGDALIRNAVPDFPVLSEHSKVALDRIGQGYLALKFKNSASPPSGGQADPLGLR